MSLKRRDIKRYRTRECGSGNGTLPSQCEVLDRNQSEDKITAIVSMLHNE